MTDTNDDAPTVVFGWAAPPFAEQFPSLPANEAEHFDMDNQAIIRLSLRGYLTDSQITAARNKVTKAIQIALNDAAKPIQPTDG